VLYLAFGSVDPQERGPHPHLRWLALAYGLSLTHHRTMLMLAPALALYLLWRDPGLLKRPRQWLPALGLALVPLLIYLYIPWRAHAQGWAMTLPEFLRYIAGTYYGPAVRPLDWLSADRVHMFWRFLVRQFGYSGIGLGVLGLIGLNLRRRWRFLACSVLAYGAYYVWGTVWYAYYNDVNSFIPNHMIYAIWIGSGALTIWQGLKRLLRAVRRPASPREGQAQDTHRQARDVLRQAQDALGGSSRLQAVFWSLAGLLPLWMIWTHAPQVDMSDAWGLTRWGEAVITRLDIAPQATILADRE
jgi:hypothetical protein